MAVLACTFVAAACGGGGGGAAAPDIPGVVVERASGRGHTLNPVNYSGTLPPSGGNHSPYPLTCGFYDTQQPNEMAVHSLEHGAVWIAYGPSTSTADIQALKAYTALDHVLVTPYAGMAVPITVVAWEHRLELQAVADPRLKQFVDEYRNGPQAPERGGSCKGFGQPIP